MKKMRLALFFIALAAININSWAAMSVMDIRREARFLTDRMGHELGLSNRQYEDVYEINFDFLYNANEVIDDVVYGYDDAIDYYYYLLDVRNEDLMYVLRSRQYRRFINRDYFYRPIYMVGNSWDMRIYAHYNDRNYFYYSAPVCYHSYSGAHYRIHFSHSYYAAHYNHALYHGAFRLWGCGYVHHHHDGWKSKGIHKPVGSRNWRNVKNYQKSVKELQSGFVYVPSREENNRKVSIDSEENRRSAVVSDVVSRRDNSARNDAVGSASRSSNAESRNSSASSASRSSNASKSSSASSASRSNNASKNSNASNASRSNNASMNNSASNASRSSNASKNSSASSASRSSNASKSSSASSASRSSNASKSSSASSASRSSNASKNSSASSASRSSNASKNSSAASASRSSNSSKSSSAASVSRSSNSNSSRSSGSRR